ncbi:hypothetical protein L2E82_03951 [Cichorium intybus]|uniref:Uncharacterized protein n=1 Tax=Cichorium intybus TaxID=13427 RepID=A0ACB9H5J9_CICIN|nr:hypothetical protein L2E82_03951 [Cichorium intybus]
MGILNESKNDRIIQLKAFDDTKSGVKGLIDAASGLPVDVPEIFIRLPEELAEDLELARTSLRVPSIDLNGVGDMGSSRREKIIEEVRHASETWGFFQVVNHGIPMKVLEEMMKGVPANWRDSLLVDMSTITYDLDPQELPSVCRDSTVDYLNHLKKPVDTVFVLLSEALGLEPDHLKRLECEKARTLACHYYPACPKPDQTLGINKHTDTSFITVLLQDEIGGLEVMHRNQWADVEPIPGALVVNIGDLLQILSNDKFKSVIHRATGNKTQARTSVACFYHGVVTPPKIYGPIEEIVTKESPQVFREFTVKDYLMKFYSRGLDEKSGLNYVRI